MTLAEAKLRKFMLWFLEGEQLLRDFQSLSPEQFTSGQNGAAVHAAIARRMHVKRYGLVLDDLYARYVERSSLDDLIPESKESAEHSPCCSPDCRVCSSDELKETEAVSQIGARKKSKSQNSVIPVEELEVLHGTKTG